MPPPPPPARAATARPRYHAAALAACLSVVGATLGQDELAVEHLAGMDLEQLMAVDVTSVAGTRQEWFQTPAAIYVIDHEAARRSGAQTLPELLRLAPGLFVGQINAQTYSISPRGFNGGLGNKTLVLIDGRRVYDPLFSGTFWNVQDVVLEDLDRIEVVRGPGPALWGVNAVNGVINVTTRSAKETQGFYATTAIGSEWLPRTTVRWGDEIDDDAWYRVWFKYFNRDAMETTAGDDAGDDWSMLRGGFRIDGEGADDAAWTLQGDLYSTPTMGEVADLPDPNVQLGTIPFRGDGRASGGNILARIGQGRGGTEGWELQAYYDRTDRVTNGGFEVGRDTAAVDWRHFFDLGDRHDIVWGASVIYTADVTEPGPNTALDPASRSLTSGSAFIQDTFTLVDDRLFFMAGSKFELNELTGFEVQPSARLWWTPNDRHTLWAAVSRAVRVPSRIEEDGALTLFYADSGLVGGGPPSGVLIPLTVDGNDDLESEELVAYELGYRVRPRNDLTLDAAVFYNDYDRLVTLSPFIIGPWTNNGEAESYGGEVVATWRPADNWRLEASYTFVDVQVRGQAGIQAEDETPHHQAQLQSYLDLTEDLELNSALYYIDNVPVSGVDAYLKLDVGVTWRPRENLELAVWGLNLLTDTHREYGNEVERAFYVQATLRF